MDQEARATFALKIFFSDNISHIKKKAEQMQIFKMLAK